MFHDTPRNPKAFPNARAICANSILERGWGRARAIDAPNTHTNARRVVQCRVPRGDAPPSRRRMRVRQSLSQENLSVDAGIDRTYVSRIERGLENPTVAILERLARAMSEQIVEFFTEPTKNEPAPKALRGDRRPRK
jgi:DNA-binding XRE family transcriptional regulator